MSIRRAVIAAGQGVTDQEFFYPYYRLQEAGFEVDVAVRGTKPCTGISGVKVVPTIDVVEILERHYEVLVLPGGVKAMEHMRLDADLLSAIQVLAHRGAVVASICSGAQLLISAKLVRGRAISGYYAMRDDIENAGATFIDEPAVVDGRIVTSPHYKFLGQWMKAVLELLEPPGACPFGECRG